MKATTLAGHSNPVYAVLSHPTQNLFYTAGNDKGIVEWDITTKSHKRVFKNVKHTVYALEIILGLNVLYAGCNDGNLLIFDLQTTTLKTTLSLGSAIFSVKHIAHKKELICTTEKGLVFIISTDENKLIHQFQSGNDKVRSTALHEKLNLLATVSNDEKVRLYNLDDFTFIREFRSHTNGVGSVAFSTDGIKLVTGGRDAHLNIYNVFEGSLIHKFAAHLFAIYQIVFHPTKPLFATASRDKSIKIWRSEDYSLFKVLSIDKAKEGHILSVNDITWSADGKYLLSVGDDKLVKIWEFDSE